MGFGMSQQAVGNLTIVQNVRVGNPVPWAEPDDPVFRITYEQASDGRSYNTLYQIAPAVAVKAFVARLPRRV